MASPVHIGRVHRILVHGFLSVVPVNQLTKIEKCRVIQNINQFVYQLFIYLLLVWMVASPRISQIRVNPYCDQIWFRNSNHNHHNREICISHRQDNTRCNSKCNRNNKCKCSNSSRCNNNKCNQEDSNQWCKHHKEEDLPPKERIQMKYLTTIK